MCDLVRALPYSSTEARGHGRYLVIPVKLGMEWRSENDNDGWRRSKKE